MERIQSPNVLRSVKSPMPQLFCVLRANTGTAVPEKRGLPRWNAAWEYSTDHVWWGVMSPGSSRTRLSLSSQMMLPSEVLRLINLNSSLLPSFPAGRCTVQREPCTGVISNAMAGFHPPSKGTSPHMARTQSCSTAGAVTLMMTSREWRCVWVDSRWAWEKNISEKGAVRKGASAELPCHSSLRNSSRDALFSPRILSAPAS